MNINYPKQLIIKFSYSLLIFLKELFKKCIYKMVAWIGVTSEASRHFSFISEPSTTIFHQSISNAIYLDVLKIGDVIPVYKWGTKSDLKNYTPILLIFNIAKIFEEIIYTQA